MTPPNESMAEQAAMGSGNGCGQRLRAAREAAGLSVHDVAAKLKMPSRIVEALEAEDWARIGAPVFVRGQLRSYSRLLGLPVELYTPLFVVARVAGWSAHIIEQLDNNRLIRPRSEYTGPAARPYVPIEQR